MTDVYEKEISSWKCACLISDGKTKTTTKIKTNSVIFFLFHISSQWRRRTHQYSLKRACNSNYVATTWSIVYSREPCEQRVAIVAGTERALVKVVICACKQKLRRQFSFLEKLIKLLCIFFLFKFSFHRQNIKSNSCEALEPDACFEPMDTIVL